jgi:hypothetical protein
MSDPSRPRATAASPAERLWRLWQRGQRPDLPAFLAGAGPLASDQLLAVVRVDQQQRWQNGEQLLAEDYFRLYPSLQAQTENALLLVYGEFLLRKQLGETPTTEEYLRRFPRLAGQLRLQFELHQALQDEASSMGEPAPPGSAWPAIPGYHLLEEVGRGSTGIVYKASRAACGRVVALKMLREDLRLGSQERARFRAEGEAVSRLSHPNVVQVYEVGEHGGLPYLALELVAGGSLARRLTEGPMPVTETVRLLETLARAVQHIHEHGVLHRDLNPANVLLASDGTPKIGDFGLAKVLLNKHALTRTGTVLGTPGYMSPEQADGRARDAGPPTDVHGLGAILYHLLTGLPPYDEGSVVRTLLKIRSDELPPPVRSQRPEISEALERICLRCLSKRPGDRYATALALADELGGFLRTELGPVAPSAGMYLEDSGTGQRLPLGEGQMVLGRAPDCDLCLRDPKVSRYHCRIERQGEQVVIADLGSTGGTWVNGRRVQHVRLHHGDRLEMGKQTFQFHAVYDNS